MVQAILQSYPEKPGREGDLPGVSEQIKVKPGCSSIRPQVNPESLPPSCTKILKHTLPGGCRAHFPIRVHVSGNKPSPDTPGAAAGQKKRKRSRIPQPRGSRSWAAPGTYLQPPHQPRGPPRIWGSLLRFLEPEPLSEGGWVGASGLGLVWFLLRGPHQLFD